MGNKEMQNFCSVIYSSGRKMEGNKFKLLLKKILLTGMDH
jgi:hypothetical protein